MAKIFHVQIKREKNEKYFSFSISAVAVQEFSSLLYATIWLLTQLLCCINHALMKSFKCILYLHGELTECGMSC